MNAISVPPRADDPFNLARPTPVDPTALGAALRALRETHEMTLRALAAKVGVSATALHHWEGGIRNPSRSHRRAIAAAFGMDEAQLVDTLGAPAAEDARLAVVIAACKRRIAAAAGTSSKQVSITIEF